jgi:hypothetical protein
LEGETKNLFSFVPEGYYKAKKFKKKKKIFFSKKNTQFCSEFNADSNHIIFFKKCWGRKNSLTATCPLVKN